MQLLVFKAVTAFNKREPHGRLVFTKCVLPSVNKVYYYYYLILLFLSRALITDNLNGCHGSCLHPMKWCSGKFDLQIGNPRVHDKEQNGLCALSLPQHPSKWILY